MNLETVEQRCLAYLAEAANPMVSISELLIHCRREPDCAGLTERTLLGFLRRHDQVRVIQPPPGLESDEAAAEQWVILKTRLPTREQMALLMTKQMEKLTEALQAALEQAKANNDLDTASQINSTLDKARALDAKVRDLF